MLQIWENSFIDREPVNNSVYVKPPEYVPGVERGLER